MRRRKDKQLWKTLAITLSAGAILLTCCKTRSDIRREKELDTLKQQVSDLSGGAQVSLQELTDKIHQELLQVSNSVDENLRLHRADMDQLRKQLSTLEERLGQVEGKVEASLQAALRENEAKRQATYEKAKSLYDHGEYSEAVVMLKELKGKKTKTAASKIQYLLAESYFANKDYASAALGYSDFTHHFSHDPMAPAATYKLALSFKKLGKIKEAGLFFQEVIERFPKSPYAQKAKEANGSSRKRKL